MVSPAMCAERCVSLWILDAQLASWCNGQHSGLRIQRSRFKSARGLLAEKHVHGPDWLPALAHGQGECANSQVHPPVQGNNFSKTNQSRQYLAAGQSTCRSMRTAKLSIHVLITLLHLHVPLSLNYDSSPYRQFQCVSR